MNETSRRAFLKALGALTLAAPVSRLAIAGTDAGAGSGKPDTRPLIKPPALKRGDTVMLVNPASATAHKVDLEIAREALGVLGLKVRAGKHLLGRHGYFAGTDAERAGDVNDAFADPDVGAVFALRGGWGCSRILPLIHYDIIRGNPKIFMGYSDITALLLAIVDRARMVTFHGPVASSSWDPFSTGYMERVLFKGDAVTMSNPTDHPDTLAQRHNRVQTIRPGRARGPIVGGNLTVLTTIIGSGYLPDFDGRILFVEDVGENIYRIDRMLAQLALAGRLKNIRGFIFGHCTDCEPEPGYGGLTLMQVLEHHIRPLNIPAWFGAMIGHIDKQFTVPEGIPVEIDAGQGTIRMLESAVS